MTQDEGPGEVGGSGGKQEKTGEMCVFGQSDDCVCVWGGSISSVRGSRGAAGGGAGMGWLGLVGSLKL